jgi:hypothetical protein
VVRHDGTVHARACGMRRSPAACIAVLCATAVLRAQSAALPSERLLAPFGIARFSRLYRTAVDAYFTAQLAYRHQDYVAASGVLDALWKLYPPGSSAWAAAIRESEGMARSYGVDFGTPPCYYALRMLTARAASIFPRWPDSNSWEIITKSGDGRRNATASRKPVPDHVHSRGGCRSPHDRRGGGRTGDLERRPHVLAAVPHSALRADGVNGASRRPRAARLHGPGGPRHFLSHHFRFARQLLVVAAPVLHLVLQRRHVDVEHRRQV